MSTVEEFNKALIGIQTLPPREVKGKKVAQATYIRQVVTIAGIKTTTGRFLPVSHAGYSTDTYVDKVDLLGKARAEFIGRKLKGIERRAHMALFRELVEHFQRNQKKDELKDKPEQEQKEELVAYSPDWTSFFSDKFGKACTIPDRLCIACWNCSLFGGLEAGKGATFSRIRYFDTFSVEDAAECIQTDDSPEQMAIGNTVGEDLSVERGEASFHRYEYVKPGTRFPFISIIESPTLLDVAGYLAAVKLADQHGYGKYSASHGKFETKLLAVSTGYPLFSVLDMLSWLEQVESKEAPKEKSNGEKTEENSNPSGQLAPESQGEAVSTTQPASEIVAKLQFQTVVGKPISLSGNEIAKIQEKLSDEMQAYFAALNTPAPDGGSKARGKRSK